MERAHFLKLLIGISIFTLVVVIGLQTILPRIESHQVFSMTCMLCYIIFCMIAFALGKRAMSSSSPYRFIQVLLMIIMGKMGLSLLIIIVYMKLFEPPDKSFVWPFLVIYVIYTVFEVYFLEKIAKVKTSIKT